MKRSLISPDLSLFPEEYRPLIQPGKVYDSSCSRQARVWFLDVEEGYYLKASPAGTLKTEAAMDGYFHSLGLGPQVISYRSEEKDWLLTARVPGEDCTYAQYLAQPERLCDLLGERLRMLHSLPTDGCPVPDRMAGYLATVEEGFRVGRFCGEFCPGGINSPEEAYRLVERFAPYLQRNTLLHGDYCLPNVMLKDWAFSGFIDLDGGGVGDRHVDLFWGAWTLNFNLKTDRYRQRFFDAYGRDLIEEDLLSFVGAAEAFG